MRFRRRTLLIVLFAPLVVIGVGFWLWQRAVHNAMAQMHMVIEQGYIDEQGVPRRKRQVIKNPFDAPARKNVQKRPNRVQVAAGDLPYSKQLQMQAGDAYVYQLPDGKTVAVWCEQPGSLLGGLFDDDSKSGLDIRWGEKPFKQPPLVRRGTGPDPDVLEWKSYITQGGVIYSGDSKREHELFVGDVRLSILLDLTAKGSLPVTIDIAKK